MSTIRFEITKVQDKLASILLKLVFQKTNFGRYVNQKNGEWRSQFTSKSLD